MYVAHASEAELKAATGLTIPVVYKLIAHRCLAQHEDGTLLGWRGAIPFFGSTATRKAGLHITPGSGGCRRRTGLAVRLLNRPGRSDQGSDRSCPGLPGLPAPDAPSRELFQWFIQGCASRGQRAPGEWPFNVSSSAMSP